MDLVNLRPLQIFHTVMRVGTVSEAARQHNITQPAVSKMLKHMEQQVGFALFKRHRGRLYPSRDAEQLYVEAERLFGHIELLRDKIGGLKESREGKVAIAAIPTIASSLMARAIARFRESRPLVRIELRAHTSGQVLEAVTRQQVDMGFVHGPVDDKHVSGELLWETEIVCLMPRNHPLAALDVVKGGDLRRQPLISLAPMSPPSWLIGEALTSAGLPSTTVIQTNLSGAACALVEAGAGIALIDPLTQLFNAHPRLVVRPFRPTIRIRTACLYSSFRALSILGVDFLDEVRATVTEFATKSPFIAPLPKTSKR